MREMQEDLKRREVQVNFYPPDWEQDFARNTLTHVPTGNVYTEEFLSRLDLTTLRFVSNTGNLPPRYAREKYPRTGNEDWATTEKQPYKYTGDFIDGEVITDRPQLES